MKKVYEVIMCFGILSFFSISWYLYPLIIKALFIWLTIVAFLVLILYGFFHRPFKLGKFFMSLTIAFLLPAIFPIMMVSNCGGNSAALSVCKSYFYYAKQETFKEPEYIIPISEMDEKTKIKVQENLSSHWINGITYKIRNKRVGTTPNVIVIVCDKLYSNVPQPTFINFYQTNPAHAVGYSNGETGLISEEEYLGLNLNDFDNIDPQQIILNVTKNNIESKEKND